MRGTERGSERCKKEEGRKRQMERQSERSVCDEKERGAYTGVCLFVTHRTMASIFFLYLGLMLLRYSGLINMAAKLKAEFLSPARLHSMTADVRMGTMSTHTHKQIVIHTLI